MKVALCLYGYFDSFTDHTSNGMDGYEHIKKNIFNKTDTDVFIHSWQPDLEDFLVDLYKPKKLISEPQIDFSPYINERNLDLPPSLWATHKLFSEYYLMPKKLIHLIHQQKMVHNSSN